MKLRIAILSLGFLVSASTRFGGRVRAETPAREAEANAVTRTLDEDAKTTARRGPTMRLEDVVPEAAVPRAPGAPGAMRTWAEANVVIRTLVQDAKTAARRGPTMRLEDVVPEATRTWDSHQQSRSGPRVVRVPPQDKKFRTGTIPQRGAL